MTAYLLRRFPPARRPGCVLRRRVFRGNPDHRGAEVQDVRFDAVGDVVGWVEPERVLAHDDVGVGPAAAQELLQALGEGPSSDVDYRIWRVRFCERIAGQEHIVVGSEVLRAGAETDLGPDIGEERPT